MQQVNNPMSGHRKFFYKIICYDVEVDESKDNYSLGLYLTNVHRCMDEIDFDELYYVSILKHSIPACE